MLALVVLSSYISSYDRASAVRPKHTRLSILKVDRAPEPEAIASTNGIVSLRMHENRKAKAIRQ